MSAEIRPFRDEEIEQYVFADSYSFNAPRTAQALAESIAFNRAAFPLEWTLGAFVDGRLVAGMHILPFSMWINGAAPSMGGVSSVACLPEHRRKGHVGALLRQGLSDMRDRGQVLSALYTPHHPLYRRYGWEIASRAIRYSFAPKDIQLVRPPREERLRRVTADEWQTLHAIYLEYAQDRNGPLLRTEVWWRGAVFNRMREPQDAALWENAAGQGRGYVIYHNRRFDRPERMFGEDILQVWELIALDADAYAGLLGYLARHDVNERIEWNASPDEPLLHAVVEPFRIQMRSSPALMLRIVDVPRALEARGYLGQATGKRLVIGIRDQSAPWNDGVWRLEVDEGNVTARAASGEADLTMDVRTLAALYNGHLCPSEAAKAGLIEVARPSALAAASDIFSVNYAPFCLDFF